MTPVRIQLSRQRGFSLDAASRAVNGLPAKKVDRTTKFGNQFRLGRGGDDERVIIVARHRAWLLGDTMPARFLRREIRRRLAGFNLACWCALGAPCHADAILEVLATTPATEGTRRAP